MHAGLITAQFHTSPLSYFQNYRLITGKCSVICPSAVFFPLSLWLQTSAKCNTFSLVCKRIQHSNEPKPSKNLNNLVRCLEGSVFFGKIWPHLLPDMAESPENKKTDLDYGRIEAIGVYLLLKLTSLSISSTSAVIHLKNSPCYSSAKTV